MDQGRFCVLADRFSEGKPEISGFWQAGKYSLYVGDRAQVSILIRSLSLKK